MVPRDRGENSESEKSVLCVVNVSFLSQNPSQNEHECTPNPLARGSDDITDIKCHENKTFENISWRRTRAPVMDANQCEFDRKPRETTVSGFTKILGIRWSGLGTWRIADGTIGLELDWKSERSTRKRWTDVVEEDPRMRNWREMVRDRNKWNDLTMAAKNLEG